MSPTPLSLILLFAVAVSTPTYAATGAELFGDHCASCHGRDGRARTPAGRKLGAHDLSQSKLSDDEIAARISQGKKTERGAERMPAFADRLKSDEIAAIVAYVKTFRR